MGAKYTNLDGTTPDKSIGDLLKWQVVDRLRGRRKRRVEPFTTPRRQNDGSGLPALEPHATWVGHVTWVFRLGKKLVATDPIWSQRIHTIKRLSAPGVALENIPPLDIVTVSHAHFDHLDLPTLERIGPNTLYVVPKDNRDILVGAGLTNVVELDWFETFRSDGLAITCVPSQHWSMRTPWDRNRRLWGGFVYESDEGVAYHAGDTAMSEDVFLAIKERCPRIDWALLPIGAYEPTWFMQAQHMGPEEAVRAFALLEARELFAMHWGTFQLTDEPVGEPPERVRRAFGSSGFAPTRLSVFDLGETRQLSKRSDP